MSQTSLRLVGLLLDAPKSSVKNLEPHLKALWSLGFGMTPGRPFVPDGKPGRRDSGGVSPADVTAQGTIGTCLGRIVHLYRYTHAAQYKNEALILYGKSGCHKPENCGSLPGRDRGLRIQRPIKDPNGDRKGKNPPERVGPAGRDIDSQFPVRCCEKMEPKSHLSHCSVAIPEFTLARLMSSSRYCHSGEVFEVNSLPADPRSNDFLRRLGPLSNRRLLRNIAGRQLVHLKANVFCQAPVAAPLPLWHARFSSRCIGDPSVTGVVAYTVKLGGEG